MTLGNGQEAFLTVSQLAKAAKTTPRTVRFYEKKGLIKPAKIGEWNNYRYYALETIRTIQFIKLLQRFEIPLRKIKLELAKTGFKKKSQELSVIRQKIDDLTKEYTLLTYIDRYILGEDLGSKVKTESIGPFSLFSHTIPHGKYHLISKYIEELCKKADELGLHHIDSKITFFPHSSYQPDKAMINVSLILHKMPSEIKKLPPQFSFEDYKKQKCLTFAYKGPYELLTLVYKKLGEYMDAQKVNISGAIGEIYLKSPQNTLSSFDNVTKIFYPI